MHYYYMLFLTLAHWKDLSYYWGAYFIMFTNLQYLNSGLTIACITVFIFFFFFIRIYIATRTRELRFWFVCSTNASSNLINMKKSFLALRCFLLLIPVVTCSMTEIKRRPLILLTNMPSSSRWNLPWRGEETVKLRYFNKERQWGKLNWASQLQPSG